MSKILKYTFITVVTVLAVVVITLAVLRCLYPKNYSQYVEQYATEYGLDPDLVYAVIKCESNFNESAVSGAGAHGLMQITADTFEWAATRENDGDYDEGSLYDPAINIRYGCAIYSILNDEFGNDAVSLAAYNAGRGRVLKWLSDPRYSSDGKTLHTIPYSETDGYVKKVLNTKKIYKLIYQEG